MGNSLSKTEIDSLIARNEPDVQRGLAKLRQVILQTAIKEGVGPIEETLKWGQLSFLTSASKAGTTVRIDRDLTNGGRFALYVHCQTNLVNGWKERFSEFTFGGNRSVHFSSASETDLAQVKIMIAEALTYHRNKRRQ